MSQESKYIHKSHNVSVLLYHIVCSAKYRRVVFSKEVDKVLTSTCEQIELRYEIKFLEIGTDADHVHFLIQSVPTYSITKIVRTIKSLVSREVFKECPEVKKQLWGGEFWGKGYFVNTVGQHGTEEKIANYVKSQGLEKGYKKLKTNYQLKIFD
ncbi:IS200/IS605 family transposase [Echinicola marina]|uniref:IS200/IS605 family transposase n=1 Tax=Echinicola marina TaxID=2859768 RepID=UPI001CF624A5|nr:IS200/IS605 family transposase [Echinicola marina]UCS91879.1 IS200/IS605 family transposase [Echinicola marina]UCS92259.1 IS200/IS605 family transposase [Echinicola marina]UCS92573.1 IS200/IS605 family transposase [Echinicola marina]UCS92720.1 IS200/IS605 family transposase [Echinicola marina]UCS92788.1 IS200/IS605 family transposase [Echinicola marina]